MTKRYILLLVLCTGHVYSGGFSKVLESVGWMKGKVEYDKEVFLTVGTIEDKKSSLKILNEEKKRVAKEDKGYQESLENDVKAFERQIAEIDSSIKGAEEEEQIFLKKQRAILKENKQVILDLKASQKEIIGQLDVQIKLLEEYLRDPEFRSLAVSSKSFYSFEYLQDISRKIADSEQKIVQLNAQHSNLGTEVETLKQNASTYREAYKDKEQLRGELSDQVGESNSAEGLDIKQQGELIDVGIDLLRNKLRLIDKKIEELNRKRVMLDIKLSIEKSKKKFFAEQRTMIRRVLRVEDTDVREARAELEKKKQDYFAEKESYLHEKSSLSIERDQLKERFEERASGELGISVGDISELNYITFEPNTAQDYITLNQLVEYREHILLLGKKAEQFDTQIRLANVRFEREQLMTEIIDSWHKITLRMFRSDEEVEQDIRDYQKNINNLEREFTAIQEKRNAATSVLTVQNKDVESINRRLERLEQKKSDFFKKNKSDYAKAREYLKVAQRFARERVEVSGKLIELYSMIIVVRKEGLRNLTTIVGELKSLRLRPAHAISWEGVKNILPDLSMFRITFVKTGVGFVKQFAITALAERVNSLGWFFLFVLLLRILLLVAAYLLLRMVLPRLREYASLVPSDAGVMFHISRVTVLSIDFILASFVSIFIWSSLYFLIYTGTIQDIFMRALFYLGSIPYLIILVQRFLDHFIVFDREQDYLFFSEGLHQRIKKVTSIVLYATIVVFLFREAFILMTYAKSEFPTILLTIYSIIVRLVIISLVTKEDILELIPTTHKIWDWLREQVEQNYYPIYVSLVALIILSEPHIGYGNYISYVLWGIIGTGILVRLLMFIHTYIREESSRLFFRREGEILRERFAYAKSTYGAFTMLAFIVLGVLFLIFVARVWGYVIGFSDLYGWLQTELFGIVEGRTLEGETIKRSFTILSVIQILLFIVASFMLASAFNRFVLKRTFNLLMVEPGVQHTISILSHYLIVLLIVLIGFQRAGLGTMVLWSIVGPLFLALVLSVKDYANDFVSYFIILVQRPFKIGDFVKIDDKTMGVIRKITPRAVMVRSKNSVTILVPNSKVVKGEIHNWNYARGFSAFDDIMVAVPYAVDPVHVKTLLYRILDENADVLKNPRPIVRLDYFGNEGFVFLIRAFHSTDNVPNRYTIASDIRFGIAKKFKAEGIQILAPARLVRKANIY